MVSSSGQQFLVAVPCLPEECNPLPASVFAKHQIGWGEESVMCGVSSVVGTYIWFGLRRLASGNF